MSDLNGEVRGPFGSAPRMGPVFEDRTSSQRGDDSLGILLAECSSLTTVFGGKVARVFNGWIRLDRKVAISDIQKRSPETFNLWINLLLMANYEETTGRLSGRVVNTKPGQILTGICSLESQTGISRSKIRSALLYLKMTNRITDVSSPKGRVISIVNWQQYQDDHRHDDHNLATTSPQLSHNLATTRPQLDRDLAPSEQVTSNKEPLTLLNTVTAAVEPPEGQADFFGNASETKEKKKVTKERGAIEEFSHDPTFVELLSLVTHDAQRAWLTIYELEWIKSEIKKANAWIKTNPQRAPKPTGFQAFMLKWLNRGHETQRKNVPANRQRKSEQIIAYHHNTDPDEEIKKMNRGL